MFESFTINGYRALALMGEAAPPEGGYTVSFTGDFGFWNRWPSPEVMRHQLEVEWPLLSNFDLRVINLEFILPGFRGGEADRQCETAALGYLRDAGFHVASFANNHAAAFGAEGLQYNIERLEEAGLAVIGLADRSIYCVEGEGLRIGIYSLTDLLDDADPDGRVLRSRPTDIGRLHARMASLDFRIGFPHLGSRSIYPSPHELTQARALLMAGTDLLVCTGSHFDTGFVELDGKPVCFGLGNHLFTWDGGSTEPVGIHLVAHFCAGGLKQLFAVPFHNAVMREEVGPLEDKTFADFACKFVDRSTVNSSRFWSDPRTQSGALERLGNLRLGDLGKIRLRHVVYGLRALAAKFIKL